MRALCGAIITAGALIGIGLACVGIGFRYQLLTYQSTPGGPPQFVELKHMDTSLLLGLTVLGISVLIGLGITFVGLAYHHHRRHLELTRGHTTLSGATTASGDRLSV